MTLKEVARLARSARPQAGRHSPEPGRPPIELPPATQVKRARQSWKDWVALNSNELPWIVLVVGVVVFAGFYVRW